MKQKEFEENVIKNISECNSLNDLCNKLGLRGVQGYYDKLNEIIKKYNLDTSHFGTLIKSIPKTKMTDEEYFIKDSKREGKRTLYRLIHNLKWERKCQECGKSKHLDEYKDNVRAACIESAKTRRKDFTKELIIDVLKKTKSFSEAGRMLNVSDNTIRKYCNKYDIPTHSNEMKAYIDKIG